MANRVYISGPMTGYEDFNYQAFHDAAARLRDAGWDVFNPAESFDGDKTKDRSEYMRLDLSEVTKCTHIALLHGWQESRGARAEMRVACECNLNMLNASDCSWLDSDEFDQMRAAVAADLPLLYFTDGYEPTGDKVEPEPDHQQFATGAVRDTQTGKPRPELISPFANQRLGLHLAAGAEKYTDRNWEQGIPIGRSLASALRHIDAFRRGETDEDHLAAIMCNAMFILDHDERIKRGLLPANLNDMPVYEPVEGVDDEDA